MADQTQADKKPDDQPRDEHRVYDQAYVTRLTNAAAESRKEIEALTKSRDELQAFKSEHEKHELEKKGEYDKSIAKLDADAKATKAKYEEEIARRDLRYVQSEARTLAVAAGIIDPADVATLDLSDLRIADDGSIGGLKEKIDSLKTSKPHWFKAEGAPVTARAGASPGGHWTPPATDNTDWATLTPEQFESKLSDILRA